MMRATHALLPCFLLRLLLLLLLLLLATRSIKEEANGVLVEETCVPFCRRRWPSPSPLVRGDTTSTWSAAALSEVERCRPVPEPPKKQLRNARPQNSAHQTRIAVLGITLAPLALSTVSPFSHHVCNSLDSGSNLRSSLKHSCVSSPAAAEKTLKN